MTANFDNFIQLRLIDRIKQDLPETWTVQEWGREIRIVQWDVPASPDRAVKRNWYVQNMTDYRRQQPYILTMAYQHTPAMVELLRKHGRYYDRDLTKWYVYGSNCRRLTAYDAQITPAAFIDSDKAATGYYTYVTTPEMLDRDTIERYELRFVSGPEK